MNKNTQEQAWQTYATNTWDEGACEWSNTEMGEWAWAEVVAMAENDGANISDITVDEVFEVADGKQPLYEGDVTHEMKAWAWEFAKANGLPSDFSIL